MMSHRQRGNTVIGFVAGLVAGLFIAVAVALYMTKAPVPFMNKVHRPTENVNPGADGKLMHASLRIGDSALMLVDEMPQHGVLGPRALKGSPVTIHLYVKDVDATVAQAVGAGAKVRMPVADMFWGDRYGQLEDPFGHRWSVATHIRDVSADEMRQAMAKMSMK